jgi:hypothetical protein
MCVYVRGVCGMSYVHDVRDACDVHAHDAHGVRDARDDARDDA